MEDTDWKARADAAERNNVTLHTDLTSTLEANQAYEAECAALRAELIAANKACDITSGSRDAALSEVERLKSALVLAQEEADDQRAELERLRAELEREKVHAKFASDEHGKADAECESLRAELTEATESDVNNSRCLEMSIQREEATATRLADVTELVRECDEYELPPTLKAKLAAFLAAQPAAPAEEGRCVKCWCDECQCQLAAPALMRNPLDPRFKR